MNPKRATVGVMTKGRTFIQQLGVSTRQLINDRQISRLESEIAHTSIIDNKKPPVIIFNASTRITGLSQNAAFSLLTALSLRMSGQPVVHYVCGQGMTRCVLGTNREDVWRDPPCTRCMAQSRRIFKFSEPIWFSYNDDQTLRAAIESLNIQQLATFSYNGMALGEIVLPSIRWVLRRHHLFDDHNTKFLYRQFILSTWNITKNFEELIKKINPKAVVVFNGMFFPEATIRQVAIKHKIRVITHEAGIRPFSGFFTDGEATAYPITIPKSYKLSSSKNKKLDSYLEQRYEGKFSMADVQFWQSMNRLGGEMLEDIKRYKQLVPIFTNVIFDTSQPHSNVLFPDMFNWLDSLLSVFKKHPKTLFVIRAHPDETRPGKTSQETVAEWALHRNIQAFRNVRFINPEQTLSSYDLIQKAKFIMVYNSTIGLEAAIIGVPVLSAGKARYTQYPTVYFPKTRTAYSRQLEEFLKAKKIKKIPANQIQSRRFLYYQLFKTSLSFERFLRPDGIWRGFVSLTGFNQDDLKTENSETMRILVEGILENKPFLTNE